MQYTLSSACWSVGSVHSSVVSCNAGQAPAFSCRYKLYFPNICPHSTEFQPAFTRVTSAGSCNTIRTSSCHAWQIYIFNACDGDVVIHTCEFCDFKDVSNAARLPFLFYFIRLLRTKKKSCVENLFLCWFSALFLIRVVFLLHAELTICFSGSPINVLKKSLLYP